MGEAFLIALMLYALGGSDDDDDGDDLPGRMPRPRPDPNGPRPGDDLPSVDDDDDPGDPVGPGGEEPTRVEPTIGQIVKTYPEAGRSYQVVQGDTGALSAKSGGIAHRAIASTAYRDGKVRGMSDGDALAYASSAAQTHRAKYWLAIEGDVWNDHLYGTYGYGHQAMANPSTKRAIRLLPQHANNYARLSDKQAPIRSILLSTPNNAGQGTGKAAPGAPSGHFELLWLPPVNVDALFGGQLVIETSGPPKWIRDLGVSDRSGAPASTKWGA